MASRASFFFYSSGDHRDLHSFPTRRSSDLELLDRGLRARRATAAAAQLRVDLSMRQPGAVVVRRHEGDRKSTRLNSSHTVISYAVFCLKKKNGIGLTLCVFLVEVAIKERIE